MILKILKYGNHKNKITNFQMIIKSKIYDNLPEDHSLEDEYQFLVYLNNLINKEKEKLIRKQKLKYLYRKK